MGRNFIYSTAFRNAVADLNKTWKFIVHTILFYFLSINEETQCAMFVLYCNIGYKTDHEPNRVLTKKMANKSKLLVNLKTHECIIRSSTDVMYRVTNCHIIIYNWTVDNFFFWWQFRNDTVCIDCTIVLKA